MMGTHEAGKVLRGEPTGLDLIATVSNVRIAGPHVSLLGLPSSPSLSQAGNEKYQSKVGLSHYMSCLCDSNVLRNDLKGSDISSRAFCLACLELAALR